MAPNEYFSGIGDDFAKWSDPYDVAQRQALFGRLFENLELVGSGLEVGCGFGGMTEYFLSRQKSLTVLDVSDLLASQTGSRFSVPHIVGDVTDLEIQDESYENVMSSECIEHSGNPEQAIKELYRVVKPGGYLFVSTPNKIWWPVLKIGQISHIRKFQDDELFLTPRSVKKILLDMGAIELRFDGCHLIPWQIPFLKPLLRRIDKFGRFFYLISINFGFSVRKPLQ
jgi:ubiquinone/menaquinone biosynthesis C-methylase UbiE